MTASALASGVVSSVISCGVWEAVKLAHHAAVATLGHRHRGRHAG